MQTVHCANCGLEVQVPMQLYDDEHPYTCSDNCLDAHVKTMEDAAYERAGIEFNWWQDQGNTEALNDFTLVDEEPIFKPPYQTKLPKPNLPNNVVTPTWRYEYKPKSFRVMYQKEYAKFRKSHNEVDPDYKYGVDVFKETTGLDGFTAIRKNIENYIEEHPNTKISTHKVLIHLAKKFVNQSITDKIIADAHSQGLDALEARFEDAFFRHSGGKSSYVDSLLYSGSDVLADSLHECPF